MTAKAMCVFPHTQGFYYRSKNVCIACIYCIVFSKHCFDRNHHIERFSPFLVNIYKQNTESLLAQININYIDIINYFVITNCKPENDPISFIVLHTIIQATLTTNRSRER